jgi:hypothetical protein
MAISKSQAPKVSQPKVTENKPVSIGQKFLNTKAYLAYLIQRKNKG